MFAVGALARLILPLGTSRMPGAEPMSSDAAAVVDTVQAGGGLWALVGVRARLQCPCCPVHAPTQRAPPCSLDVSLPPFLVASHTPWAHVLSTLCLAPLRVCVGGGYLSNASPCVHCLVHLCHVQVVVNPNDVSSLEGGTNPVDDFTAAPTRAIVRQEPKVIGAALSGVQRVWGCTDLCGPARATPSPCP
jgi:hypothetical protein